MIKRIYPGIGEITLGTPSTLTPHQFFRRNERRNELQSISKQAFPFNPDCIIGKIQEGNFFITLPLSVEEKIYGLGLQLQSFVQNGKRKTLSTNADVIGDTGGTNAPVPFYDSTNQFKW